MRAGARSVDAERASAGMQSRRAGGSDYDQLPVCGVLVGGEGSGKRSGRALALGKRVQRHSAERRVGDVLRAHDPDGARAHWHVPRPPD